MRVIAPPWKAQNCRIGVAASIFTSLAYPACWLCQLSSIEGANAPSLPEPVMQLLASSVATVLKTARMIGLSAIPTFPLTTDFVGLPALWQSATGMLPAAAISFLLPRMVSSLQEVTSGPIYTARAVDSVLIMSQYKTVELCTFMVLTSCHATTLANKAAADLLHCSGPTTAQRDAHFAIGKMSFYAANISAHIAVLSSLGCKGAPLGSAQLRDLLARPLLHLLHSPMLDTLVALQHVMVEKFSMQRGWESTPEASIFPLALHESMEPDATDSKVGMQASLTCYSGAVA